MKNTEKSYLNEEERKKQQLKSEKELKKEQEKILRIEKKKETLRQLEADSRSLQKLRDLLEQHIIDDALVKKVLDGDEIDHDEIQEIFEQIDAIEDLDGIDDYLPKDMRVTKEEYAGATHDDEALKTVLKKIDTSLWILASHASPQAGWSINIFSGFLAMLDKNLVTIQEHHIDMKTKLEPADSQQETLWETIKKSFR